MDRASASGSGCRRIKAKKPPTTRARNETASRVPRELTRTVGEVQTSRIESMSKSHTTRAVRGNEAAPRWQAVAGGRE